MEMEEIISNINKLNSIKKDRQLTNLELEELTKYRKMYLSNFKKNLRNILDNTKIIDEEGKDITPNKKGKL